MASEKYSSVDHMFKTILKDKVVKEIKYDESKDHTVFGQASDPQLMSVVFEDDSEMKLFVKVCKKGTKPDMFNKAAFTMDKEVMMYTKALPKMVEFQKKKGIEASSRFNLEKLYGKCLGCGIIDEDIYVVLENIMVKGYQPVGMSGFHTIEQARLCFEGLAIWHATAYAVKSIENTDWLKECPLLEDLVHAERTVDVFGPLYNNNHEKSSRVLKVLHEEFNAGNAVLRKHLQMVCSASAMEKVNQLTDNIYPLVRDCRSPTEPFGVVCHGDCNMYNMAFQGVTDVIFFDFQVSCYASGFTDIHYYTAQSTTPEMRKNHMDELLQLYNKTFIDVCKSLGVDEKELQKFSLEEMKKEYVKRSSYLFIYAIAYMLARTGVRGNGGIEQFEKARNAKTAQEVIKELEVCGESVWTGLNYVFRMIEEVDQMGTLDAMISRKKELSTK